MDMVEGSNVRAIHANLSSYKKKIHANLSSLQRGTLELLHACGWSLSLVQEASTAGKITGAADECSLYTSSCAQIIGVRKKL